jgi:hypothetical protein
VDRLWKSCVKLPRSDFLSREALALDISRVVSRLVSGEPIDTAERGAALAAKYPELGINAELIGQAIDRAANMVGLIKTAPLPRKLPREQPRPVVSSRVDVAEIERPAPPVAPAPKLAVPPRAFSIDDELAAAIDAEIGNLVTTRNPVPMAPVAVVFEQEEASVETEAEASIDEETESPDEEALEQSWPEPEPPPAAPTSKGPFSALRRAFFRR